MTKAKKVPGTVTSLNQSQGLAPVIFSSHRIKLFPERKHRKVVVHPQAAKAEHRRPGCPLLGATKKTCKILQLSQCPHITCNNCKLGEYVRWGGGGGGWWVASCSGKGVENLMGL